MRFATVRLMCVRVNMLGTNTLHSTMHAASEVHFVIIKLEYPTIKWC